MISCLPAVAGRVQCVRYRRANFDVRLGYGYHFRLIVGLCMCPAEDGPGPRRRRGQMQAMERAVPILHVLPMVPVAHPCGQNDR